MSERDRLLSAVVGDRASRERVLLLLQSGVRPDARDEDGATVLHSAASLVLRVEDLDPVRALIQAGAQVDVRARTVRGGGWAPLHLACLEGSSAMVGLLLEAGADANAQTDTGWTPLMLSIGAWESELKVRTLLAAGADPSLQSASEDTAASLARELLQRDVDVEVASVYPLGGPEHLRRGLVDYIVRVWEETRRVLPLLERAPR